MIAAVEIGCGPVGAAARGLLLPLARFLPDTFPYAIYSVGD